MKWSRGSIEEVFLMPQIKETEASCSEEGLQSNKRPTFRTNVDYNRCGFYLLERALKDEMSLFTRVNSVCAVAVSEGWRQKLQSQTLSEALTSCVVNFSAVC